MKQEFSQSGQRRLVGEFPASISQRSYLAKDLAEGTTIQNLLSSLVTLAFLVEPQIDLKRLERAAQRLAARHDSLRMSFVKAGEDWRVQVWDRSQLGLRVTDHSDMGEAARSKLLEEICRQPIDILADDLVQYHVARLGQSGDLLVVRAHHSVVDGHSMLILTEELLKFLLGIPVIGAAVSHGDYMREVEQLSPQRQREIDDYWQKLLFPVLPQPGAGSFGTGFPAPRRVFSGEHFKVIHHKISLQDFEALPVKAGATGQTGFSVILAAFAQTYLDMSGLTGIYVMSIVDRLSPRLASYVGCAIHFITVRCENPGRLQLGAFAEKLNAQVRESVAHLPSEACGLELKYDHAVFGAGGVLRHISCVEVAQHARARKSAFAGYMDAPVGARHKIGKYFVARLPLKDTPRPICFELRVRKDRRNANLEFCYHNNFYADDKVAEFIRVLQQSLCVRFS